MSYNGVRMYSASKQGIRPTNEDKSSCIANIEDDMSIIDKKYALIDFCAICDGHGGDHVSKFVCPLLEKHLTSPNLKYPLSNKYINDVYDAIQEELVSKGVFAEECGTTAIVVIRFYKGARENIQVINVGDCRAVMSIGGIAKAINSDHKPFQPDERRRLQSVNVALKTQVPTVFVNNDWRILGLSVTRCFGDINQTPFITHKPEIFNIETEPEDEFIIVACDGLWESLDNYEAVAFVRDHLIDITTNQYNLIDAYGKLIYPSEDTANSVNIAKKLAEYAIVRGSTDNVSVNILLLG